MLDDGLTQHGDHIERLQRDVGRRDAVIERLEAEVARLTAELQAAAESIQARDHIITALQAKIRGDFPGGPQ